MSNHLLTPTKAIRLNGIQYMLVLEADPGITLEGETLQCHANVMYVGKATVVRPERDGHPTIMGNALKRWAESVVGDVVDSNPAESGVMVVPGRELFEAVAKLAS